LRASVTKRSIDMSKGTLLGLALAALTAVCYSVIPASAADPTATAGKHRVVFQVTDEGEEHWEAVLGNVEHLREAFGPGRTEVEVVGHGKGLGMLLATNRSLADRMQKLADDGVVFAACENTMKKKHVTKDQLLPFATTVDSGVAEVVRKQEAGWSYIKS
jgi:uncharacterized protein